jgi:hypothetical protein
MPLLDTSGGAFLPSFSFAGDLCNLVRRGNAASIDIRQPSQVIDRPHCQSFRFATALPSGATFSLWVGNFPSAPALGFSFVRSQKQRTPER